MQNYLVELSSEVFTTFRCQKAANSLDIDTEKKSKHRLEVDADLATPFNVGLIVGSSGSGKTTLAKNIFGDDCFKIDINPALPVIDQFPEHMSYDDCALALTAIGLTSVPCWIRPVYTLSNGQRARAEAALLMSRSQDQAIVAMDEWTSVVDRTVAKVMSFCVAKFARRFNRTVVLNSCHYDVIEWLNPDWIIDCNRQTYEDRRTMVGAFERTDRLRFDVKPADRKSWRFFSKYHYLNDNLSGGKIYNYGLWHGKEQIGFQSFAAYIMGDHETFFFNRTVIHPDYTGLGLGIKLINETSRDMVRKGFKVRGKFSSTPVYKAMSKEPDWRLIKIEKDMFKDQMGRIKNFSVNNVLNRREKFRHKVVCYIFEFIWREQKKPPLREASTDQITA